MGKNGDGKQRRNDLDAMERNPGYLEIRNYDSI